MSRHHLSIGAVALACAVLSPAHARQTDGNLADAVVVRLTPADAKERLPWSPKGASVPLTPDGAGRLQGQFRLGPAGAAPIGVRLSRSRDGAPFDRLEIDRDRDGAFDDETALECTPSERRSKVWSHFGHATIPVPVQDPWGTAGTVPYRMELWFVLDPREPEAPRRLRWSRRGFFTGTCTLDGEAAFVMICERRMDGILDRHDAWGLAPDDDRSGALGRKARDTNDHAWLGERAYRLAALDASGLLAVLVPTDPGVTRAEEAASRDHLAVDRRAARSGKTVRFSHAFPKAEGQARENGQRLLVDFETVWCGPCKLMDQWVYTADDVVAAARNIVAVKVDGDASRDLVKRFKVRAYPTLILLDADGKEIRRHVGYMSVADTVAFLGE